MPDDVTFISTQRQRMLPRRRTRETRTGKPPRRGGELFWCIAVSLSLANGDVTSEEQNPRWGNPLTTDTVTLCKNSRLQPGETFAKSVVVPKLADDERAVLVLRARLETPTATGCNYGLDLLIDGIPLTESPLRPRLLNKASKFTPPSLPGRQFQWLDDRGSWMVVTGPNYEANWAGTGQDYDYLFDLSGWVQGGHETTIAVRNAMPEVNPAVLVVDNLCLGVMKRVEVERTLALQNLGKQRNAEVMSSLPHDAKPGPRPYEIVWSGRTESPRAQVSFEDLKGWTMEVVGDAEVSLSASVDYRLWRKQTAKFSYAGGETETTVAIRPPAPVEIPGPFDAANLIVYGAFGQNIRADLNPGPGLHIIVLLEDGNGREVQMDLGRVKGTYWTLQHGILPPARLPPLTFPMKFRALVISNCNLKGKQSAYFESLAFYQQNRKPLRRLKLKPPIYPVSEDGNLPTLPARVNVRAVTVQGGADFLSEAGDGTLRFCIRPAEGSLSGVSARWNDATVLRPMEGGGIKLQIGERRLIPKPGESEVLSSELKDNRFFVRRRYSNMEWQECYWVHGRTLVVDLTCKGGVATGVSYGLVTGLDHPKGIEVPYLLLANKPGPWIACGNGLFVSVLPDLYHSDFSSLDDHVASPQGDKIGLWGGSLYSPLTNGRRNDLRERVLVTISTEFADTLPNAQNLPSPNREKLAPYMYLMESAFLENFLRTTKRYGVDYIIADSFVIPFVSALCVENAFARWRLHPDLPLRRFLKYRKLVKEDLGYLFGSYLCFNDLYFTSEYWDENRIALGADGNWSSYWPGAYTMKDVAMPWLARDVGRKMHKLYPTNNCYMDVTTIHGPYALDYEAGVEGAGIARVQWRALADSIVESRQWAGTIASEGFYRWMYAGLTDMDYATLPTRHVTHPAADFPLLVDFDLLKIHPFEHGTMMSYGPSCFLGEKELKELKEDDGCGEAPQAFYRYVSASLAYGHMLMAGYGYIPKLARFLQLYCLMQGVQKEYLTDAVEQIRYHNGKEYLPSSLALRDDSYTVGRVCVRYRRGLRVQVNYNKEQNWLVTVGEAIYDLPPFGWIIDKPGSILAFSALVHGQRVDYVSCPEYVYLNSGGAKAALHGLEVEGAVWLKHEGESWHLIPCGDLGPWEIVYDPPHLPKQPLRYWDMQLTEIPDSRGCNRVVIDTAKLLGKRASDTKVIARADDGKERAAKTKVLDEARLEVFPAGDVVDYRLK
ncbi:MAG: hypothetical protein HY318_16925 [Armatimonadetes bacterium]|nr:hypothetical protein [Armatimonadota bacterium]